jgi:hypothetical protein
VTNKSIILYGILAAGVLVACRNGDGKLAINEIVIQEPLCDVAQMRTPEDMEQVCGSWKFLPIPLSDGSTYESNITSGGPYKAKIEWNEGEGSGYENLINPLELGCDAGLIELGFGEPRELNEEIKDRRGMKYDLYTIFRPAEFKEGELYPLIVWANGTCGATHGYAVLLSHLASHGYVVIASNSTWQATPPTNNVQTRALDFAEQLNSDSSSILYQRLDLDRIGAAGHSQGAGATGTIASDPRVKALALWNAGTSAEKPFLNVSGDQDTSETSPEEMATETEAAGQPGAWTYYRDILDTGGSSTGHLVLMLQPDRVVDLNLAWWDYMLKGKPDARNQLIGDSCDFCSSAPEDYEYGHNTDLQ